MESQCGDKNENLSMEGRAFDDVCVKPEQNNDETGLGDLPGTQAENGMHNSSDGSDTVARHDTVLMQPSEPLVTEAGAGPEEIKTGVDHEELKPQLEADMPVNGAELGRIFRELGDGDRSMFEAKVRAAWSKVRYADSQKGKLAVEEELQVVYMLSKLRHVWEVPQDFVQKTKLKSFLELLANPERKFSKETAAIARKLHERFQARGWGEPKEPIAISVDDEDDDSSSPGVKRRRGETTNASPTTQVPRDQPGSKGTLIRYPLPTHAIYGLGGVMRGIVLRRNLDTKRESRILDPNGNRKSAKKFGDNGLNVGQWWPMRICLIRDGAHGSLQGGIYGNGTSGAYSVVVSRDYSELDDDESYDRVKYSSPRAPEGENGVNKDSGGLKALRKSVLTRKPVRLFRGASGKKYSPHVGYRYDGLFRVMSEDRTENGNGELSSVFLLERVAGQAGRDTTRPTQADKRAYVKAQENY